MMMMMMMIDAAAAAAATGGEIKSFQCSFFSLEIQSIKSKPPF